MPVLAGRVGPLPEGSPVTRDRARKKAIRARMAATGEPYSVAARDLHDTPAARAAVVREGHRARERDAGGAERPG